VTTDSPTIRVGHWASTRIPTGWVSAEGSGLHEQAAGVGRASVVFLEETLPDGESLQDYVRRQAELMAVAFPGAEIGSPTSAEMRGAVEALELRVQHTVPSGTEICHRQIYCRAAGIVGVLTLTAAASRFPESEARFEEIRCGVTFGGPEVRPPGGNRFPSSRRGIR
jgi:hypothetical protein